MSRFSMRLAVLLGGVCLLAVAAAGQQSLSGQPAAADSPQQSIPYGYASSSGKTVRWASSISRPKSFRLAQEVSKATKALSEAETDDERADAEDQLRAAVAEQFDQIVQERQNQIDELETRLERLKAQLTVRREAKEAIVDLRVQVLINEAKGLGFYPNQNGSSWPVDSNAGTPFWTSRNSFPAADPVISQPQPSRARP